MLPAFYIIFTLSSFECILCFWDSVIDVSDIKNCSETVFYVLIPMTIFLLTQPWLNKAFSCSENHIKSLKIQCGAADVQQHSSCSQWALKSLNEAAATYWFWHILTRFTHLVNQVHSNCVLKHFGFTAVFKLHKKRLNWTALKSVLTVSSINELLAQMNPCTYCIYTHKMKGMKTCTHTHTHVLTHTYTLAHSLWM